MSIKHVLSLKERKETLGHKTEKVRKTSQKHKFSILFTNSFTFKTQLELGLFQKAADSLHAELASFLWHRWVYAGMPLASNR